MYGGIQQPRKHTIKGVDTPEPTREQKAKASEVEYDARYMDEDEVMKTLFGISPTCLEYFHSIRPNIPSLSGSRAHITSRAGRPAVPAYPEGENNYSNHTDHDATSKSDSLSDNAQRRRPSIYHDAENPDGQVGDVTENLAGDILDDCADKLIDSKNKSNTLSSIYTFFATHNILRRSLLRSSDWKIESCIDYLVGVLSRQKSLKGEQSIKTGTNAAKLILLLLWCMRKDFLASSLSGTLIDSLSQVCLSIIPQIPNSTKNRAVLTKPAAQLVWYCFAILGTLQLFHINTEYLPGGVSVMADSVITDCEMEWIEFVRRQMDYLLGRKAAQKSSDVLGDGSLSWKTEEVLIIDGLFFVLACMLVGEPSFLRAVRSLSKDSQSLLVWKSIRRLITLLDGGGDEFMSRYGDATEGLLSVSSDIALGLPSILGLCYEGAKRQWSPGETSDEQDIILSDDDNQILDTLNLFCRKGSHNANKYVAKNLSKELTNTFRDVQNTILYNEIPRPLVIDIQRHDVLDCVSKSAPELELEEVTIWTGCCVTVEGWSRAFIARCCRAFGGDHAVLTVGSVFEDLGYTDALKFQEEDIKDRKYKTYGRAINKKYWKQERQINSDRKARLRGL